MKNIKTCKVKKHAISSSVFNFFKILVTLPIFMFFMILIDSACPTHSLPTTIVLTTRWSLPLKDWGVSSNLYQTWYGLQWFFMITTKHGFSLYSEFTKIWSPPYLPLCANLWCIPSPFCCLCKLWWVVYFPSKIKFFSPYQLCLVSENWQKIIVSSACCQRSLYFLRTILAQTFLWVYHDSFLS